MARQRAEKEAAEPDAGGTATEAPPATTVTQPDSGLAAGRGSEAPPTEGAPAAEAPKPQLDEKHVARMMLELRAEEPNPLESVWLINMISGVAVALIGLAITVWGVFALGNRSLGATGVLAGFVMLMFGIGFMATGAWLVYRALRQQGVL